MVTILGCMELLYQELGLDIDRQAMVKLFGPTWSREDICAFMEGYGYVRAQGEPQTGDIVFVANHPGIVRGDVVENIHHGRRTFMPLRRLRHKIDLVLRCL